MLYNLCNNTSFTYTMTILICKRLYHIIDLHKCYSHNDHYIEKYTSKEGCNQINIVGTYNVVAYKAIYATN